MRAVALAVVLITPWLALGDESGMQPSIQEAKKQSEERFLAMPGVVSVGIGLDPSGNQTIIVGLEAPNPETEANLPEMVEGFPVIVRIIGSLKAQ